MIPTPSRIYPITSSLSASSLVLQPLSEVVPCTVEPSLCCDINDDALNASDLSVWINRLVLYPTGSCRLDMFYLIQMFCDVFMLFASFIALLLICIVSRFLFSLSVKFMFYDCFVLQLSYDLTWQKLKEKFSHCGMSSPSCEYLCSLV